MTLAEEIVKGVIDELNRRKGLDEKLDEATFEASALGAVQETLDSKTVAGSPLTVVELLTQAIAEMEARRSAAESSLARPGRACREFSIAITAAEDAAMRYTRGRAHELGVFKPADLDSRDAIEERHEWTGNALKQMDAKRAEAFRPGEGGEPE